MVSTMLQHIPNTKAHKYLPSTARQYYSINLSIDLYKKSLNQIYHPVNASRGKSRRAKAKAINLDGHCAPKEPQILFTAQPTSQAA
jgi:hypothetical protein